MLCTLTDNAKWECGQCTYLNYQRTVRCAQCYSLRELCTSPAESPMQTCCKGTQSPPSSVPLPSQTSPHSKVSISTKICQSPGHKAKQSPPLKYRQSPPLKSRQSPPMRSRQSPPLKLHQSSPKGRRSPPRQLITSKQNLRSQGSPKATNSPPPALSINNRVNHETQTSRQDTSTTCTTSSCSSTAGEQQQKGARHKWCCLACTYANWPRSVRCIMCATPKQGSSTADDRDSLNRHPCSGGGNGDENDPSVSLPSLQPPPPPPPPPPSNVPTSPSSHSPSMHLPREQTHNQMNSLIKCSSVSEPSNNISRGCISATSTDSATGDVSSLQSTNTHHDKARKEQDNVAGCKSRLDDDQEYIKCESNNLINRKRSDSVEVTESSTVFSGSDVLVVVSSTTNNVTTQTTTAATAAPLTTNIITCDAQQHSPPSITTTQHNHINNSNHGESGVRGRCGEGAMALNVSNTCVWEYIACLCEKYVDLLFFYFNTLGFVKFVKVYICEDKYVKVYIYEDKYVKVYIYM